MHGAQRRLPSRIKQESRNSRRKRVLSASRIKFKDKRSQGTLVFSSPPKAPPSAALRFFHALPFLLQIQFSSSFPSPSHSPHFSFRTLRNIARNNVKYLLSGRLFPSVRRDKHHYVMYIKPHGRR